MKRTSQIGYVAAAVLAVILIASLLACNTEPASTSTPPKTASTPKSGGILKWNVTEPSSFFPASMTGQTDGWSSSVCLETLFRFDEKGNVVPLLATDWKADPTGKTVTLTLRKNVKFHDGTDFNAEACKWNLDTYKKGTRPELKNVTSVDVVDDYTVRLNLASFDNTIITMLANGADCGRMISPTAFKTHDKAWCEQNPVGTGPFQFVSRQRDVGVKYIRFDGYWDGKPYLDGIELKVIGNATTSAMDFQAGNLDMLGGGTEPNDAKAILALNKFIMVLSPEGQVPAICGAAKNPDAQFADIRLRQAISYAIDTNTMCNTFGLGFWKLMNQWAVPGSWGYNTDIKAYPYNPAKAKQLLAEAGFPNGMKTTLNFYNASQMYIDEAQALQNYFKAVGIDCEIKPLLRPAYAEIASLGKGWNGLIRQQGSSSPDPLIKYAAMVGGQEYLGALMPQEFVDVYNQAKTAPDAASKQKLVWQLMSLAVDKYCIASHMYMVPSIIFKTKQIKDDQYGLTPYRWLSPKTWLDK
jgi:peptide/nickel transport system substrate-binding protein